MFAAATLRAQAGPPSIVGSWESDEKDVRMGFFQDGGHYNARLLWGNRIAEADGKTYNCKAWLEGEKLHLRGFMGFSLMGENSRLASVLG